MFGYIGFHPTQYNLEGGNYYADHILFSNLRTQGGLYAHRQRDIGYIATTYCLPQGSVLGLILFSMYTSTTADIIWKHGLKYNCYADDTQIYISVDPTQSNVNDAVEQIEACLDELRRISVNITQIRVGDIIVTPTYSVTNLGVSVGENLPMDKHITKVSRIVCVSIRTIDYLSVSSGITQSRAHYFPFQTGHVQFTASRPQQNTATTILRLQNTAARLVTLSRKFTHIFCKNI